MVIQRCIFLAILTQKQPSSFLNLMLYKIIVLFFHARASPTFDEKNGIPKFVFPDEFILRHDDLPDECVFDWMTFRSDVPDTCSQFHKKKKQCLNTEGCGWCPYSTSYFPAGIDNDKPLYNKTRSDGWTVKQKDIAWSTPVIVVTCVAVIAFVAFCFGSHFYTKRNKSH